MRDIRFLSGNSIKIIAAITMLIDHIGLIFYPIDVLPRAIGRIAFPLFAYMLAEGARYTRNKRHHILLLGGLALICQVVFCFATGLLQMSILVTFTLSLGLIYLLEQVKGVLLSGKASRLARLLSPLAFLAASAAVFAFCRCFTVDYGFVGCMAPVILSLPSMRGHDGAPPSLVRLDNAYTRLFLLALVILLTVAEFGPLQFYALLSLPLVLLYSGKRGRLRLKYFFYVFYPSHLVLLYGLYLFL